MTVSICIPAYNAEKYIEKTLYSILGQTYTDLEIIVLNNASIDNTYNIVKSFRDSRIKFFENEKTLPMTENWHKVVSLATNELVQLVCADDLLNPDTIEKEVEAFRNNDIVLTVSDTFIIDSNDKKTGTLKHYFKKGVIDGEKLAVKCCRSRNLFGAPLNNMFYKSIFDKVGGYDITKKIMPDLDLALRIASHGNVYNFAKPMASFRVHNTSVTKKVWSKGGHTALLEEYEIMFNEHIDKKYYPATKNDLKLGQFKRKLMYFLGEIYMNLVLKN